MAADTIHFFLNPTAGRGRAGKRRSRIIELMEQSGFEFECHLSRCGGDLESQVRRQVDMGANRIVVAGGDGSIHEAVNGILSSEKPASLGIVPIGTGNDFAKACDIPLNWEHATQLLADRIRANESPRKIDAGRFNQRFFANGAGIGFDANVTRIAQSIHLPIGDLVYLLAVLRQVSSGIASPSLRITAGDTVWNGPVTLAAISNGPWVGGMFRLAPMAINSDAVLELLIAKPVSRWRLLTLLPKLMDGTHMQEAEIVHHPVTSLSIHSEQAIPSQLDGEVQPLQTDFEVAVLPGALSLL